MNRLEFFAIAKGDETPWGPAQIAKKVADGLYEVSTASHGGIIVSPLRLELMPTWMREANYLGFRSNAFEEDVSWCLPVLVYRDEFRAWWQQTWKDMGKPEPADIVTMAEKSCQSAYPAVWARWQDAVHLAGHCACEKEWKTGDCETARKATASHA